MPHSTSRRLLAAVVLLFACVSSQAADTLTYTEPFGLAHKRAILSLALAKPVDPASKRLVDASGKEVPYQVAVDGKSIKERTANGTSASDGRAGRIMRSYRRS